MAPLNIIIIGAGIGGPAAAIALTRNGHKVTIFERGSTKDNVGFAFRIMPNSDRCLRYLGVSTQAGGAVPANVTRLFDAEGKTLFTHTENPDKARAAQGASVFAFRVSKYRSLVF